MDERRGKEGPPWWIFVVIHRVRLDLGDRRTWNVFERECKKVEGDPSVRMGDFVPL